jgi:hypothetical protein
MEEKFRLISCKCELKLYIYAFLLPFLFICIRYFRDESYEICKPKYAFKILKYNLPHLFYLHLPKIFSIICILIVKFNARGESISSEENLIIKNYHITVEKRKKKKVILLLFIISILEVLQDDGDSLIYYYQRAISEAGDKRIIKGWLIEKKTCYIFFVPIFSYFILQTEIHRHHVLALILGYFGAIFVNGVRFFLGISEKEDYPYHLLIALFSLIYSLALVLIKFIMIKYILLSPYIFLFCDGIFCILNAIIITLLQWGMIINLPDYNMYIKSSIENDKYFSNNFLQIFKIFSGQEFRFYLFFFLSFILSIFYYIINTLILFNYSPFLIILVEALLPLDSDIIKIIFHDENDYIIKNKRKFLKRAYYQTIGYAILFVGALILNEIIIFNCCGFNKNTSSKITLRGKIDSISNLELGSRDEINEEDSEI